MPLWELVFKINAKNALNSEKNMATIVAEIPVPMLVAFAKLLIFGNMRMKTKKNGAMVIFDKMPNNTRATSFQGLGARL